MCEIMTTDSVSLSAFVCMRLLIIAVVSLQKKSHNIHTQCILNRLQASKKWKRYYICGCDLYQCLRYQWCSVFVDDDYDDYDDEGSEKEKYKKEREDEYGVCYLVAKAERKKHVRIKVLQST